MYNINVRKIKVEEQPNKKVMRTSAGAYIIKRRLIMKTNRQITLHAILGRWEWDGEIGNSIFLNK